MTETTKTRARKATCFLLTAIVCGGIALSSEAQTKKSSGTAATKKQTASTQKPAPPAQKTSTISPPKMEVKLHTLPNGLRLLMLEDHSSPIVNAQVWYHVGSKDERAGRTGFAHLFEHLMYKGSAHVATEEHSRIIEAAGGVDNATTRDDATIYWETFPSNYLERVMWLEADRMGSLKVDDANFKSEREVVKEERRANFEDRPYGLVFEDLYAAAFTVHPYSHTAIGSMEDLNKATIEDVQEFHRTFYRPDNATMVLAGDFDPAEAIAWATKYFSGISKPAAEIPLIAKPEPPQAAEKRLTKAYANAPLPAVVVAYKMPAKYSPDSYALEIASNILAAGESSRLFKKMVYEDQIAAEVAGFGIFSEDPNLFMVLAVMNEGKSVADGEKSLNAALLKMKQELISKTELEKSKNQIIAGLVLGRRTVQQKAGAIADAAVFGHDAALVNTQLARYLAVTAADIQRVAQKYFVVTHRTVLIAEPAKK
ncbi:MAG: insulinase family protein [Acidobacteria bacterium]|nr:insulinase family protein [Acidobacteriota bacterium]